ncbi:hypothetical protein CGMCC3_g2028 [Colletotrichum fructicola]|nr:uncharacterized protein CGMCC3_g2028 [Colletotrichum fructicola]KAE9581789.1 hypothetical protein CGMCC3_g2028 [Colletotrichum fructicola]
MHRNTACRKFGASFIVLALALVGPARNHDPSDDCCAMMPDSGTSPNYSKNGPVQPADASTG